MSESYAVGFDYSQKNCLEKNDSLDRFNYSKVQEMLDHTTNTIVNLYYHIEHSILVNGNVPKELIRRLRELRKLNSIYKQILNLDNPSKIDLPEEFENDYKDVKERAEKIIENTNKKIETLKEVENSSLYIEESLKRISKLKLLREHYERVLGS